MRTLLLAVLLALLASLGSATRGSISRDLFANDVNDDEHEIIEDEDEPWDMTEERKRNPCFTTKCKRGESCIVNKEKKAECVCRTDCGYHTNLDPRYKACSNNNITYETECYLDQDHCRCKRQEKGCSQPGVRKIQLEYYGACTDSKECPEEEAIQFPGRMKDWLFVVMGELDRRSKMKDYKDLYETAKADANHTMAVIWKFCDLDKDPQDRVVSRRELQYMVRSLRVLEHCLVPFLDTCDANDDRKISLVEWGECLGIDHEKITDKCHKIAKKRKNRN